MVHLVTHVIDKGFSAVIAASMLTVIGGVSIGGRILMGGLGDRIGNRQSLALCFALMSAALLLLPIAYKIWDLYLFAAAFGFTFGGMYTLGEDFSIWDRIHHLILPVTMGMVGWVAWYSRFLRSSMLEVINQDYIRTAHAKGMTELVVIVRHALRNAFLPIVTVLGINLGLLLGGAVLTETIFSWPGLGRYVVDTMMGRDYNAVQACILIFAVLMVVINLLVDLIYVILDPRIRVQS